MAKKIPTDKKKKMGIKLLAVDDHEVVLLGLRIAIQGTEIDRFGPVKAGWPAL